MLSILNERQITQEEAIELELEELAPEKFDPEITFKVNKEHSDVKSDTRYRPLTREETAALFAKGKVTVKTEQMPPAVYDTLPREVAERLVREHFEHKENMLKKQKESESSDKVVLEVPKVPKIAKKSTKRKK